MFARLAIVALVAAACNSSVSPSPSTAAASSGAAASQAASVAPSFAAVTPAPIANDQPGPNGGVVIRWFVGLGAGGQPQQFAAEQAFVDKFNSSQKDVFISLEIYNNNVAANILKTQIAAGNAPDIIGPVGVEGLNLFRDQLLDLKPLITSSAFDMSKFDAGLAHFFDLGVNGATIGVPFATYPSYLWYNKKLFDEAGLAPPPTRVGDLYDGKPWDMDAVRTIAMKLTVDKNGNDATSSSFDAANIVQWGFDMQWADNSPLAESSLFGASSFVGSDSKTAQIGDPVRAGEKWFNDGVWKDHFIPNANQINSDLLAKGNLFQSGNLAMDETHSWYSCCVNPAAPAKPIVTDFGWAVAPSYNGKITAKLHADTFSLLKTTKHPDAAFKALATLAGSGDLLAAYGAFPADPSLQQGFFDTVNAQYPKVKLNWDVPKAMLAYPDVPNHQAWVPDYAKSKAAWQKFQNNYRTSAGVDIDAQLDALKQTLQGIFDAAE
ncbi:MAG TPA: extracellular solute-binding protein [Candidatus Limnocylindrales bacterium]|nr:extracellular solute-binding protein [Candidatus Limnocylindrales bacterium]